VHAGLSPLHAARGDASDAARILGAEQQLGPLDTWELSEPATRRATGYNRRAQRVLS
jgi:hypothetical protein